MYKYTWQVGLEVGGGVMGGGGGDLAIIDCGPHNVYLTPTNLTHIKKLNDTTLTSLGVFFLLQEIKNTLVTYS